MAEKKQWNWPVKNAEKVEQGVNKLPGWAEKIRDAFSSDSSSGSELDKSRVNGSERSNNQRESGNT